MEAQNASSKCSSCSLGRSILPIRSMLTVCCTHQKEIEVQICFTFLNHTDHQQCMSADNSQPITMLIRYYLVAQHDKVTPSTYCPCVVTSPATCCLICFKFSDIWARCCHQCSNTLAHVWFQAQLYSVHVLLPQASLAPCHEHGNTLAMHYCKLIHTHRYRAFKVQSHTGRVQT